MATCPHCNEDHPDELVVCPNTDQVISKAAKPADPLVGNTLEGKYKIENKLGEGGMGAVYIGEHLMMKRRVAIKTLLPQFTTNDNAVQRFQREAQAASAIGHPNIVTIHDLGQTPDGMLYIVMELLDGRDLGQEVRHLKNQGVSLMDPTRAFGVMTQVAEGLAAAHEKGVVHRDLKPDNIFLSPGRDGADRVRLLDFGISKIRTPSPDQARLTTDGSLLGTPYYMSPEQAQGKSDIDHRADIYAYGVILYELLTGRVPFEDDNMLRVIAMHALEEPPPPRSINANISPDVEGIIQRAMAKDPAVRFQTMNDVLAALKAAGATMAGATAAGFASVTTGDPSGQFATTDPSGQYSATGMPSNQSWGSASTPAPAGVNTRAGMDTGGGSWSGAQGSGAVSGNVTATPMAWSDGGPQKKGGAGLKIALGIFGVLVVLGTIGGIAIAMSMGGDDDADDVVAEPAPIPMPTPTPTPNPYQNPTPTPVANPYNTPTPVPTPTPGPTSVIPTLSPTPTPATPTKVSVRIQSQPSKAKVYEGSDLLGQTPLDLSLDHGTNEHRYVIKQSGYRDHPLAVVPDQNRVLDVELRRAAKSTGRANRGGRGNRGNRGNSGSGSSGRGSSGSGSGLLKQMPTF